MRVVLIAVGKIKERGIREAVDDYVSRAKHYLSFEEIELKDRASSELHPFIQSKIPPGAHVVALDARGKALSSEGFARWLELIGSRGKGCIAFLIGPADGLPPATLNASNERLSLSAMTLPHRLARLILCEQIYRAMTILRGEPYSR